MDTRYVGIWIRQQRLVKNWSQDGLCKGVCAVSYLSKIEQGKVQASPEVLHGLLNRLGIDWIDTPEDIRELEELVEGLYESIFSADKDEWRVLEKQLSDSWSKCRRSPFLMDGMILRLWCGLDGDDKETLESLAQYEELMNEHQHILFLHLTGRYEELLRLYPIAFSFFLAGLSAYKRGNYTLAVQYLQRCYLLAAEEGQVFLMMESKTFTGNCYSNLMNVSQMLAHYKVARRLAQALNTRSAADMVKDIDYNIASTELELGQIEKAYAYFSHLENASAMALHKLAVCYEKMGQKEEALKTLCRAELAQSYLQPEKVKEICSLVRYRLIHPDYLHDPVYGEKLLSCFAEIRRSLPSGYAVFHLPWVLEWYTENRLYKEAYQLLLEFPNYHTNKNLIGL